MLVTFLSVRVYLRQCQHIQRDLQPPSASNLRVFDGSVGTLRLNCQDFKNSNPILPYPRSLLWSLPKLLRPTKDPATLSECPNMEISSRRDDIFQKARKPHHQAAHNSVFYRAVTKGNAPLSCHEFSWAIPTLKTELNIAYRLHCE